MEAAKLEVYARSNFNFYFTKMIYSKTIMQVTWCTIIRMYSLLYLKTGRILATAVFRRRDCIRIVSANSFGQAMATARSVIWFRPAVKSAVHQSCICQLLLHAVRRMISFTSHFLSDILFVVNFSFNNCTSGIRLRYSVSATVMAETRLQIQFWPYSCIWFRP